MLTVEIRQINFTDVIHALADAACRHAEQRDGQIAANLYQLAADINAIGKDIHRAGLTHILNSQLPGSANAIQLLTGQQRILDTLKDRPGITVDELAETIELTESTTRQYVAQLTSAGKITRHGRQQPYTYSLAPNTEITNNSPLPAAGRDGEEAPAPITNPYTANSLAARIFDHIVEHPGATNQQIADAFDMHYITIVKETGAMKQHGHIEASGQRPARHFPIHPTPPTVQVTPHRAPATTP